MEAIAERAAMLKRLQVEAIAHDRRTCKHDRYDMRCLQCCLELGRRIGHQEACGFKDLDELRAALC